MGNQRITILILAFLLCFAAISCTSATGPDNPDDPNDPDTTPKSVSVEVKYVRIEPWYLESAEVVFLNWSYTNYADSAEMPKISENTHTIGGIMIKTETGITMRAEDWRKRGAVRKRFFIDGFELIFNGSEYGDVVFVHHNDGTIELISPR